METLSSKAKKYLYGKIRLAWKYYSEYRKTCLKAKKCLMCGRASKLYADHKDPIGSFKPEDQPYLQRVFTDLDNLQPLCKTCHDAKTKLERAARKKKKS